VPGTASYTPPRKLDVLNPTTSNEVRRVQTRTPAPLWLSWPGSFGFRHLQGPACFSPLHDGLKVISQSRVYCTTTRRRKENIWLLKFATSAGRRQAGRRLAQGAAFRFRSCGTRFELVDRFDGRSPCSTRTLCLHSSWRIGDLHHSLGLTLHFSQHLEALPLTTSYPQSPHTLMTPAVLIRMSGVRARSAREISR